MKLSYDEAIVALRRLKEEGRSLVADFRMESIASVHALCGISEISDNNVTLVFGRGLGGGSLTLPLRNAEFTYLTPRDLPFPFRSATEPSIAGWLEIRFYNFMTDGCRITEFKPGVFVSVSGLGAFSVDTLPPSEPSDS